MNIYTHVERTYILLEKEFRNPVPNAPEYRITPFQEVTKWNI